ncbi:MAG: GMC oxidoreductase, partial [Bacteroidia bacterium]
KANNISLGRTALAHITKDSNTRKAYQPQDLDYYSDKGESAYRPWITVNELKKINNFTYKGGIIVKQFKELENGVVEIITWNKQKNEEEIFRTQKLVLAPGVLGTARIVLRSFNKENQTLPLLCNPYAYFPCINSSQLGKTFQRNTTGFAQLSLFHDNNMQGDDIAMASLYSYKSLMLFRIIKEAPVNFRDGISLMNFLMPAFVIMGLHHPEKRGDNKTLNLRKDNSKITGDSLQAEYRLSESELHKITSRNSLFKKAMRKLGALPVKMIDPGMGSSIHYAGVLPFENEHKPFSLSPDGRLHGTQNVFVADGSGFRFLPAKGLTLSLMANAHSVAQNVLKQN